MRDFENEEGLPYELWLNVMSRVLLSRKSQEALAELEEALLSLPDKRIIAGHLAKDDGVCAVGLYIAHRDAKEKGIPIVDAIAELCRAYDEDADYSAGFTIAEARNAGLGANLAWHLAFLNDDEWYSFTPEQRYDRLLSFVRNALGREQAAA